MSLMISISGIRGIIGESLTPEVVVRYARGFGAYCRRQFPQTPHIVVGRDGRITGRMVSELLCATLEGTGVRVTDLGVVPTPTVQLAVEQEGAAGGVAITASHNPMQWNGMKFLAHTGMFLDAEENREFWTCAEQPGQYVSWDAVGSYRMDTRWINKHIEAVLSLPYIDRQALAKRRFRIVVDCVNAAGGMIIPALLRELGCDVIEMNCDVSGVFSHTPEPIPENLTDLAAAVKAERADLGIAVDPDVDRLVLITDKGEPYGEEYTIATAVQFVLTKWKDGKMKRWKDSRVVVNLSTTRAVDDIAHSMGAAVVRTPVGEINVAKRMKQIDAIIGGEGSGGVILPDVHLGRDAMVGTGLILQHLLESGLSLSALKDRLPRYAITKGKMELSGLSPDIVLQRILEQHSGKGTPNTDDGVKIDFPDYWVHLRKSNTEPIIRIIAEASSLDRAQAIVQEYKVSIGELARR